MPAHRIPIRPGIRRSAFDRAARFADGSDCRRRAATTVDSSACRFDQRVGVVVCVERGDLGSAGSLHFCPVIYCLPGPDLQRCTNF